MARWTRFNPGGTVALVLGADPAIDFRSALSARAFQAVFPLLFRFAFSSPELQFATKRIADPETIAIPTRHKSLRALLYKPTRVDIDETEAAGRKPPVHLLTHGGAFIIRVPEQEDNVARFLASELGAYVVVPDFDTAPQARHPASEHQAYDAFVWVHENGDQGWDGSRLSVGGPSAGGQVALSVVIQAIDAGAYVPVALSTEYGACDFARPDSERTSPKRLPVVSRPLMRLVRNTYFLGANLKDPLVSPFYYARLSEFPPTLILTGGLDTLRHEMNELAVKMAAERVDVTHKEFPGVDHGFTHTKPVDVARQALEMIAEHLRRAYSTASVG